MPSNSRYKSGRTRHILITEVTQDEGVSEVTHMLSSTVEGPSAESTPYRENRGASSAVCGSMPKSSMLEITWHPSMPCQLKPPNYSSWLHSCNTVPYPLLKFEDSPDAAVLHPTVHGTACSTPSILSPPLTLQNIKLCKRSTNSRQNTIQHTHNGVAPRFFLQRNRGLRLEPPASGRSGIKGRLQHH